MKILITVAFLALSACSESRQAASEDAEARETVFDPLMEQVDEAKAVGETVEQHKRDIDAALEEDEASEKPL